MRASYTFVLTFLLLAIAPLSAQSQDAPPAQNGGRITFKTLDADSDGNVTLAEFTENFPPPERNGRTPQPDRVFSRWDADGDGSLTAEEFENRPRRQGQQRPEQ